MKICLRALDTQDFIIGNTLKYRFVCIGYIDFMYRYRNRETRIMLVKDK